VERCEWKVDNYVAYENSLCAAHDFIRTVSDEITANSDTTGDLLSVSIRLQSITELASTLPEGRAKIEACVNAAAIVDGDFDGSARQSVDDVQKAWQQLEEHLNDTKQSLNDAVKQWNAHKEHCDSLDECLRNMEKSVKKEVMISDVDEIRPLVKSYEVK